MGFITPLPVKFSNNRLSINYSSIPIRESYLHLHPSVYLCSSFVCLSVALATIEFCNAFCVECKYPQCVTSIGKSTHKLWYHRQFFIPSLYLSALLNDVVTHFLILGFHYHRTISSPVSSHHPAALRPNLDPLSFFHSVSSQHYAYLSETYGQ